MEGQKEFVEQGQPLTTFQGSHAYVSSSDGKERWLVSLNPARLNEANTAHYQREVLDSLPDIQRLEFVTRQAINLKWGNSLLDSGVVVIHRGKRGEFYKKTGLFIDIPNG